MTKQKKKNNELQIEFERGFINRYFAQISLPHSKLEVSTFTRKSGNFTLDITVFVKVVVTVFSTKPPAAYQYLFQG